MQILIRSGRIFQTIRLLALISLSFFPSVQNLDQELEPESGSSESEEDGDCGLDAVPSCFLSVQKDLECISGLNDAPCVINVEKLITLCTDIQVGLNHCTVNIIGKSCTKLDPKHSYFLQWLPSLNSVINNFCTGSNLEIVASALQVKCMKEPMIQCLLEAENQVDWLEIITSQMHQDICINIELKAQDCLARHPFPFHCKEFVQTVMNASESFLDKSGCYNQPSIFVPFNGKNEVKSNDYKENYDENSSDRECELDSGVLASCFKPLLDQWKCYLNSESTCNFSLKEFCTTSKESLNSCVQNLIGYGCEGTENHQYFKEWLGAFNTLQDDLCSASSSNDIAELQLRFNPQWGYLSLPDFKGLSTCWTEFFTCFHHLGNSWDLINLITLEMSPATCRIWSDKIQFCMVKGILNSSKSHCDTLFDKIGEINNKFIKSPGCTNKVRSQTYISSTNSARLSLKMLQISNIIFVFILRIIT